jgi:hypothetical protein
MAEGALIYDVGAHKGEDTEFYLIRGFSVIAIEAVPELCERTQIRRNHIRRPFRQVRSFTVIARQFRGANRHSIAGN